MSDEVRVVSVPLDTGWLDEAARELGYRDVADLQARGDAERAKLDPTTRDLLERLELELERDVIGL